MLAVTAEPPVAAGTVHVLRGRTSEGAPLVLTLRGGRIVRVRVTLERYVCVPQGDIAPVRVDATADARIGPRRRFGFSAGAPSERLRVDGTITASGLAARGSLRLRGTIGTGDPCRSPRVRFRIGARPQGAAAAPA